MWIETARKYNVHNVHNIRQAAGMGIDIGMTIHRCTVSNYVPSCVLAVFLWLSEFSDLVSHMVNSPHEALH